MSGNELQPEESLSESTQFLREDSRCPPGEGVLLSLNRAVSELFQSCFLKAEQTEGKGAASDTCPRCVPGELFLPASPRHCSRWV